MNDIPANNTLSKGWLLLFSVWVLATISTLASLFFSEVVKLPVCSLCWYQRIAMYPLVVILPMALFPFDAKVTRYASVLVLFGWLTALFHVLLVAGYIPKSAQPCVQDIPCSETHLNVFGFLNMPMMSLLTFSLMALLLFFMTKSESS
ncbi:MULTISPECIES: disulfide bond formation protein B [unclassified Colwellia]|jgi:disulfide bond formation protein DsbB|uniref:disulfide bond formation protein B n=1 Tax=unclassified Colwellia TaxID=196834 RepID=UPI0015F6EAB3|nr:MULTISPECIES: disulfide bond formation protein B [unclassified Colwellia]MBA6364060.1 disulfide bond formation protein B [Colwellia sp. BRX8-8]MBA6338068.1 disulfide bond formation protein B [Colwellia sp. BRX8-7]MBA6351191.1 disulfide bond formation protein B [Colwellia sp. BRX9-1]MBA6355472.1 disulfide bond formation protein B [Colwellia sp. BRX8-3]MBA6358481.1 disulfide bond formation protein B [Colwellia sp. BRX8-6]